MAEIELVKKQYNFKYFKMDDDTFSLHKPWLLEFCEKYAQKFDMGFECNVRVGTIDEECLVALKKAGCQLIKVGLEAGNEKLRKEILGRNISNEEIIKLFALADKVGLQKLTFNMIGIPGETKKTIRETINLNAKIKADFMLATVFYPYPETLLGEKCAREGLIIGDRVNPFRPDSLLHAEESALKLPGLTARDIKEAVKYFKFNVYRQYDLKKALTQLMQDKKADLKKFIIAKPIFHKTARIIYRFLKK